MATAQKQKNCTSAVVFPNKITTEQQSLTLVKRLLAVAVSCITYLRGIFPESAYGTRYLDDLCVRILREDKNCPGSTQLVKWMLGCYDALQKKYLRMIVLAVYTHPEDPQTITECYHFKFKYTHNGPLLNFSSKSKGSDSPITCADTKKASILLIRKIYVLMQNLGPLPNDVCLTMKLFYYDEVTPPDYQPPGFKEGECEGMIFEGEPMHLNMGEVPTPFHMLKVKVTTDKQRMENADESILKQGDTDQPLQVLRVDRDDPEENQHMDEDPVLDNKVEVDNRVNTLEAQENRVSVVEEMKLRRLERTGVCTFPIARLIIWQVRHLNLICQRAGQGAGRYFKPTLPNPLPVKTCCQKGGKSVSRRRSFRHPSPSCWLLGCFSTPLPFGCLMRLLIFKCSFRDLVLFVVKMLWVLRKNLPRSHVE